MQITGEQEISASRQKVWAALMDPDVLARCIDGVDALDRTDDGFAGVMNAKVGPVRAKFKGAVAITESQEPSRYVLVGEGKGGVAGFAKGSAEIDLTEAGPDRTLLTYTANSQVGGKLAQLGARLVEGAAKGYAERFFENFRREVEEPAAMTGPGPADAAAPAGAAPVTAPLGTVDEAEPFRSQSRGAGPIIWAGVVVVIAIGIVAAQFL
ncbi:carbon monoxide dehydrogenase subunit G [Pacificimonas sp. WHA3]|uniref:Carbon monoxide dehydrogenase subunit G n=1 Tax=Pacificimonas pallii TaxID=2827236 RepID=A0ABS6SGR6_9SPHN|nr:carbon monoxide dehydrogenase subunit G [Pacificimonas pallii]MBV7257541.1 carbon monoxide dehydrogenase subunit G [Pacificimonas pallii]